MLHHLKKWLAQISIARPPPAKPTLIMELVPAIKEGIEKQVKCTSHLQFTPDITNYIILHCIIVL